MIIDAHAHIMTAVKGLDRKRPYPFARLGQSALGR